MAQAKKIPIDTFNVELVLTHDEASVLYTILHKVGGESSSSRRHADAVLRELKEIKELTHLGGSGSIYF